MIEHGWLDMKHPLLGSRVVDAFMITSIIMLIICGPARGAEQQAHRSKQHSSVAKTQSVRGVVEVPYVVLYLKSRPVIFYPPSDGSHLQAWSITTAEIKDALAQYARVAASGGKATISLQDRI